LHSIPDKTWSVARQWQFVFNTYADISIAYIAYFR
jgi:hypothetical protein